MKKGPPVRFHRPEVEKFAFRVDEACHSLGIGRTSLYEMMKAGELKTIVIAGRVLVPRSEMERLTKVSEGGDAKPGDTR